MVRYTVKQLADRMRISVRTLHHYDEIGLLKPAWVGNNGYRYYEQPQLHRLRQVLMYRDLGMPLEEIRALLDASDAYVAEALRSHRQQLAGRLRSLGELLDVIERTLQRIDGDTQMSDTYPQIWQSEEKAADYKQWLMDRYSATLDASFGDVRRRLTALTPEERTAIHDERLAIEADLAAAFRDGMTTGQLAASQILARHRAWLAGIWGGACPPQKYAVTADVFAGYGAYRDHFDGMAQGLTEWLTSGMKAWAAQAMA